jgi:DNA-binding NtrC family response regulator
MSPRQPASEPRHRRTILVVDDEPDMLENVVRILRRGSHDCLTALGGEEALALVERNHPDVVLTDLRMAGVDGMVVLHAVKRLSPRTPVVLFTAYASDAVADEAMRAGAAGFLAKPFTAAQLLEVVRRALQLVNGAAPEGSA